MMWVSFHRLREPENDTDRGHPAGSGSEVGTNIGSRQGALASTLASPLTHCAQARLKWRHVSDSQIGRGCFMVDQVKWIFGGLEEHGNRT